MSKIFSHPVMKKVTLKAEDLHYIYRTNTCPKCRNERIPLVACGVYCWEMFRCPTCQCIFVTREYT